MSGPPNVKPALRLVPAGLTPDRGKLRLVLIATPVGVVGVEKGFPLSQWPMAIRAHLKQGLKIWLELANNPKKDGGDPIDVELNVAGEALQTNAETAWQSSIAAGNSDIWQALLETINRSIGSNAYTNEDTATNLSQVEAKDLAEQGELLDKGISTDQTIAIKAVIPIEQGALALHLEAVRAKRVYAWLTNPDSARDTEMSPESLAYPKDNEKDGQTQTEQQKLAALNTAIKNTKLEELKKARASLSAVPANSAACAPGAFMDHVKSPDRAIASHVAGNWAQTKAPETTKPAEDATKAPPINAKALETATHAYAAITSSPSWARIFGFAFDLEVSLSDEAKDALGGDKLWVSAQPEGFHVQSAETPKAVAGAWTAVDKQGWPRPLENSPIVNGFYELGKNCSANEVAPRFDLVTLDMRLAANGLSLPDAKSGKPPPAYQTAGFTIVDRGRGADAAAQLKRTGDAAKATDVIKLYADDLAVARKLDVGVLKHDQTLEWRALGTRAIDYGFRRANGEFLQIDDALLTPLLGEGEKRANLEQASLSPAARLAPQPGGGGKDREAFVEEAFATWDGLPMGVYCGPEIVSGPSQKSEAGLHFLQRQSLPKRADEDGDVSNNLAAPLRDGKAYQVAMRVDFLGGVSRSVSDTQRLAVESSMPITYPEKGVFRRFVRQEAVGAPLVLLPGSVLDEKPGEMDFEAARSVVLRSSLPPGDKPDGGLLAEIKGRSYVTAAQRAHPDKAELVRIFVPPQTGLDVLLRSGILDNVDDLGRIAKGGLREIAFGVSKSVKGAPTDGVGSFPLASIQNQRAFGFDETRISLKGAMPTISGESDKAGANGAAIMLGNSNAANKGIQWDRRPYFPDPYAKWLHLRLRRRSNGAYAGTSVRVPVYNKDSVYPDAMPTVLVVKKGKSPPIKALADDPPAIIGKPKLVCTDGLNFNLKSGQRVQRVELTLAPGDDFELEAFYLPDQADIATHFALTESISAYGYENEEKSEYVTTGHYPLSRNEQWSVEGVAKKLVKLATEDSGPSAGPVEELSGVARLRLAHAVNQPLAPALFAPADSGVVIVRNEFNLTDDVSNQPGLKSAHLQNVSKIESAPGSKDYLLKGRLTFDRATTSAIEILATCVSPRETIFDDQNRRRPVKARIARKWVQKTQPTDGIQPARRIPADDIDVYGFWSIDDNGVVELHRSEVALLRIDAIAGPCAGELHVPTKPGDCAGTDAILDLAVAHAAAQMNKPFVTKDGGRVLMTASQLHAFPDGKARRLNLRLRAVSRFAPDFTTAPRWTGGDGTNEPVVRARQTLQPLDQFVDSAAEFEARATKKVEDEAEGRTAEVWLKSTVRPDKCQPLSPLPIFRTMRSVDKTAEPGGWKPRNRITRYSGVRIYLDRGWYSSGEGELLGIVLPAKSVVANEGFQPDDRFGAIGPYLTRWGGDPIREDYAPLTTKLDESAFGANGTPIVDPVRDVRVPVQLPSPPGTGDAESGNIVMMKADLLTYVPRFDIDREQWFVDLDIQAPETPNLFVRFGLVRYQPNAISDDLMVSEPVVAWSQLLPSRTFETRMIEIDKVLKIEASVSGPSHKEMKIPTLPNAKNIIKTTTIVDDDVSSLHRPTIEFRLVHESGKEMTLRRVTLGLQNVKAPTVQNSWTKWETTFSVPKASLDLLESGNLYVFVTEREAFLPATYSATKNTEPINLNEILNKGFHVLSGPHFIARMDIDRLTNEETGK